MGQRWRKLSITSGVVTGGLMAVIGVITMMPSAQGCDDNNPRNTLCCSEFAVGADVSNVDFGVDAAYAGRFRSVAQAASDVGATATAMLNDVTTACRNIALGLGADPGDENVVGKSGSEAAKAWCALAKTQFADNAAVQAVGTLNVAYQPPVCRASLDAQAQCHGRCQVDASCEPGLAEVRCEEGKLSVQCTGQCSGACNGSATAAARCEGSCEAECQGTCDGSCVADVNASVNCQGDCTGKCTGKCDGSTADGVDCGGECVGQCQGSCAMNASASIQCNGKCEGTCKGKCTGRCELDASAEIDCDGSCQGGCDGTAKAPKCEGEVIPPSCDAEADCQASCDASLEATAECTPPEVTITANGMVEADVGLDLVVTTLKANLPTLIVAAEARGEALVSSIGSLRTDGNVFFEGATSSAKGVACGAAIIDTVATASVSATAAVAASTDLLATISGT
ncbi:MAG: hypothetical protein H6714_04945 [Myxococcales bacterium]|nr:hypothetical protein [Myxococcales bacterium]